MDRLALVHSNFIFRVVRNANKRIFGKKDSHNSGNKFLGFRAKRGIAPVELNIHHGFFRMKPCEPELAGFEGSYTQNSVATKHC